MKMRNAIWAVCSAGLIALGASEANAQKTQTYFACKTKSGKIVKFSRAGQNVKYSYGKPGVAPDLTFSVSLQSASFENELFARGAEQRVSVTFNGTTYKGISGFSGGYGDYGSVVVTRGNRKLAENECARGMQSYIEADFKGTNADKWD